MLQDTRVLNYLAQIARLGTGSDYVFDGDERIWLIEEDQASTGLVDEALAREIFSAYAEAHPEAHLNPDKVELLLGLRILRDDKGSAEPLLMLPCVLNRNGTLESLPEHLAWVALRRLKADTLSSEAVTITYLDAYRAHQELMEELPEFAGWQEYITRAIDLFAAMVDADEPALVFEGVAIDSQNAMLRIFEHDDAGVASASTLSALAEKCAGSGSLTGAAARLFKESAETEAKEGQDDELHLEEEKSQLESPKSLCGTLAELSSMSERDHEVAASLAATKDEPLVIVDAPAGTAKVEVALSAIASGITEAAIEGKEPPHSLMVGTREDIEKIISLFQETYRGPQSSLFVRWLPRISVEGDTKRTLGPLPTLFCLFESDASRVGDAQVVSRIHAAHLTCEASVGYASSWYVPQAATYYLDCVSGFLGTRVREVSEARVRLADRLRVVDSLRRDLMDAYANVCRADERMRARDDLMQQLSQLRRKHTEEHSRLVLWEEVARRHPQRFTRFGGLKIDQSSLIRKSAQEGEESFIEGKVSVDEVVEAYRDDLAHIETEIDRLRAASTQLNRRVKAAQPEGERCMQLISRLVALLKLDNEQQSLLEGAIDGTHVSLEALDKVLDQTVRAAEFWLALHIFESRWMPAVRAALAKKCALSWKGFAALNPLILCEDACVHSVVKRWGFGETTEEGGENLLDELVILSAERMSQCEGAALMGACERALVFGAQAEVVGPALIGPTFAEVSGKKYWKDDWAEAKEANIVPNGTTTFFDLCKRPASSVGFKLTEDQGQLSDLVALRKRIDPEIELEATSRDDERERLANAVARVMAPLSYVLVPDSSWEQLGGSRINESQAYSMLRWLERHAAELSQTEATVAIIVSTRSQERLMRRLLSSTSSVPAIEVLCAQDAHDRRFDVVIWDTVSGPDAIKAEGPKALSRLMSTVVSCAVEALLVFCGSSWTRSDDACAKAFFDEAACIGRLFSVARERATGTEAVLRPQALTRLLHRLAERGDIASAPETPQVSRALASSGLIRRVRNENGRGWVPTDAGLEVGIIETTGREGVPFCVYSRESEAVVARIVNELLEADEEDAE